jgi:hypothetical protein
VQNKSLQHQGVINERTFRDYRDARETDPSEDGAKYVRENETKRFNSRNSAGRKESEDSRAKRAGVIFSKYYVTPIRTRSEHSLCGRSDFCTVRLQHVNTVGSRRGKRHVDGEAVYEQHDNVQPEPNMSRDVASDQAGEDDR